MGVLSCVCVGYVLWVYVCVVCKLCRLCRSCGLCGLCGLCVSHIVYIGCGLGLVA